MFEPAAVLAGAFAQHLVDDFHLVYGKREPDHGADHPGHRPAGGGADLVERCALSRRAAYHDGDPGRADDTARPHHGRGGDARGLAAFHGGHLVPRPRLPARRLPGRSGRPLRDRRRGPHDRRAARRLGRVPRPLPHRARQDLRPPPLQDDQAPRRRAHRPGDRAHPLPDPRRRRLLRRPTASRPWCAPPT